MLEEGVVEDLRNGWKAVMSLWYVNATGTTAHMPVYTQENTDVHTSKGTSRELAQDKRSVHELRI